MIPKLMSAYTIRWGRRVVPETGDDTRNTKPPVCKSDTREVLGEGHCKNLEETFGLQIPKNLKYVLEKLRGIALTGKLKETPDQAQKSNGKTAGKEAAHGKARQKKNSKGKTGIERTYTPTERMWALLEPETYPYHWPQKFRMMVSSNRRKALDTALLEIICHPDMVKAFTCGDINAEDFARWSTRTLANMIEPHKAGKSPKHRKIMEEVQTAIRAKYKRNKTKRAVAERHASAEGTQNRITEPAPWHVMRIHHVHLPSGRRYY